MMSTLRRHLIASVAFAVIGMLAVSPVSAKDLSAQLKQAAKSVNAQLPKMVDSVTRLDKTQGGPGNTFTYDYTLVPYSAHAKQAKAFGAKAREKVLKRACGKPAVLKMLKSGVTMHYVYRGKKGGMITAFSIHASDCGKA